MSAKILIVEDEALVATEIQAILETEGYRVVGIARNGSRALELMDSRQPDLVLLDITIKGELSGIDVGRLVHQKYACPHVFLTAHSDMQTLNAVKATFPYGYIVKPFTEHDLRSNIELALFKYQSESQDRFPAKDALEKQLKVQLTEREYELYELLYQGKTYKEIGATAFISVNTVKLHLKNLFAKLGVSSRHEAARLIHG